MKVTTKGKFAVTAMIEIGLRSANQPVSLADISRLHGISMSYLEQLFGKLRRHGLVRSVRGPGGGYVLEHDAASITLADIVAAVDDPVAEPADFSRAAEPARCDTAGLWRAVTAKAVELLGAVPLATLVEAQKSRTRATTHAPAHRGISANPVLKPVRTNAPNSVFALGSTMAERPTHPGSR